MIIIETCPKCGHDLTDSVVCTNPPIPRKECCNCGWYWEGQKEQVVRIPFNEMSNVPVITTLNTPLLLSDANYESVCDGCGNNPRNGGSGICHCILGIPKITC